MTACASAARGWKVQEVVRQAMLLMASATARWLVENRRGGEIPPWVAKELDRK